MLCVKYKKLEEAIGINRLSSILTFLEINSIKLVKIIDGIEMYIKLGIELITFPQIKAIIKLEIKKAIVPSKVLSKILCLPNFFPINAALVSEIIKTNIENIALILSNKKIVIKQPIKKKVDPVKEFSSCLRNIGVKKLKALLIKNILFLKASNSIDNTDSIVKIINIIVVLV